MNRQLLVCFDVDGTLVDDTVFIWQTLHDAVGTDSEEREHWSNAFWNNEITYSEWAQKDIDMWREKGIGRSDIHRYIKALRPMKGALETLRTLYDDGHTLGIISGSLDIVLEHAFPDWKVLFSHIYLNKLIFDDDVLTGIQTTPYDIDHKADGLFEMAHQTGFSLNDTVFIGDNFNDISVARIAGLSIAFNCKSDALKDASTFTTQGKDLRIVLPLIREFALNGNVKQS
jgi:phosphoserine phosphatase